MLQDYSKAKKLGEKTYRRAVAKGQYPYLPSLEQMVEDVDRYPEIPLGLAEIPLEMIVGTRTSGRQNAFAADFMPLMAEDSEFAAKWSNLYDSQVEEGIRDPVKAYEFMNRFYVEEGNKRVSVLRYVGAVSIAANVIRIRPPRTDSEQSRLYYEYLDFYRVTRSFEIVLSRPGDYEQLARILEQNLQDPWPEELLEKLHAGFLTFKAIYRKKGGMRLNLTVGDALLIYLGVYSLDSLLREGSEEIGRRLLRLWREFAVESRSEGIALIERREDAEEHKKSRPIVRAAKMVEKTMGKTMEMTGAASVAGAAELAGAFAGITAGAGAAELTKNAVRNSLETVFPSVLPNVSSSARSRYSPASPLRVAFLHEMDARHSGWVYGHELGRNHLKEAFGSLVETMAFQNCRTEEEIQEAFDTASAEGCGMIFTTSPFFSRPAFRFAVEHPEVKVLNCSFNQIRHSVRFYYGKMYEAKYLMGALAASLTDDHRIGYIAGRKDPAALSNINAFALGAQLIDPYCRVELEWLEGEKVQGAASGPEGSRSLMAKKPEREQEEASGSEGSRSLTAEIAERAQLAASDSGENLFQAAGESERASESAREALLESLQHRRKIHIISDIDMIRPGEEDRRYGLYLREDSGELRRLAAPIWNWGVFYEIVVRKMLNGVYDREPDDRKDLALNYWLGLSSGIIEFILSDDLPEPSCRLIKLLRRGIEKGDIHPFAGKIMAQDGTLHETDEGVLSSRDILTMDWLVENVDGRP